MASTGAPARFSEMHLYKSIAALWENCYKRIILKSLVKNMRKMEMTA